MIKKSLLILLLGVVWANLISYANATLPVKPFEAHYTVYGKGLPIGESVMTLTDSGEGRYTMRSEVYPSSLTALLISDRLSERASGEFRDGVLRPLSYEQQRSGGKQPLTARLSFDWQNRTVQVQTNAERVSLPLTAGTIDPLSLHLQVMWDLRQGRKPSQYSLVDVEDAELKTYQVKLEGEETIQTPLGDLRTLKISQSKPGSRRVTTFWFAPSLDYLTVQIAQQKKGQETLRMLIREVKRIGG